MIRYVLAFLIMTAALTANFRYVPKLYDLFENNPDAQIYVIAGGRSKGATWGIGQELIIDALQAEHLILCTREIKATVDVSSRATIERLITRAGLKSQFDFYEKKTVCKRTGSTFIYTGLSKVTEDNVQGAEGITRAWLGEAHMVQLSSWQKLEPTVRENGAKIYIDYNTQFPNTPMHMLFTADPNSWPFVGDPNKPQVAYTFLTYEDNPFCPERIREMAERQKSEYSRQDWEWIWLGKLKDSSEKYVCSYDLVEQAQRRTVEPDEKEPIVCGCDIAHMGGDEIVFYKRQGNKVLDDGFRMSHLSAPQGCDELEAYLNFNRAAIIVMDNGHVGAAWADEMTKRKYNVERVNFGGTKEMHFDAEHSKDCATDMAFNFAAKLPHLDIPHDIVLRNQLTQRKWDFVNANGVRKIESKDDFKKHAVHLEGHKSPDRADALWLAFYNRSRGRLAVPLNKVTKVW